MSTANSEGCAHELDGIALDADCKSLRASCGFHPSRGGCLYRTCSPGLLSAARRLVLFFPALVMFVIRNRKFSFFFLALYVLLSIQMSFQARSIYLGTYVETDPKFGPLSYPLVFLSFSAICLVFYAIVASISLAIAKFNSTNN